MEVMGDGGRGDSGDGDGGSGDSDSGDGDSGSGDGDSRDGLGDRLGRATAAREMDSATDSEMSCSFVSASVTSASSPPTTTGH